MIISLLAYDKNCKNLTVLFVYVMAGWTERRMDEWMDEEMDI